MRALTTISKNLKLLFRNKESAYTIVFGPILIILLVSFAFLGSDNDYTVRLGAYAPTTTALSDRTITTLSDNGYQVSVYPTQDDCVQSVTQGTTHACIVFSEQETGNGSVPVTFYLDMSRVNLVYQIADALSGQLDIQANQIREQLATNTLQRLETGATLVEGDMNATIVLAAELQLVADHLRTAREALSQIPTQPANVTDIKGLKGYQQGLAANTREVTQVSVDALEEALETLQQLSTRCQNCSESLLTRADDAQTQIEDARAKILYISEDVTKQQLTEANLLLEYAIEDVEEAESSVRNASSAGIIITRSINLSSGVADQSSLELQRMTSRLAYTRDFLRGERTSADTISAPITTKVVSVTASNDRLSFAYPYLLMLVIMFIGMLLASTLVVTDKTSRAAFRNFTTPTTDRYHVLVSFLTAFLILLAETVIILLLSGFFVAQPLLLNPASTIFIVAISIVLFTFLGMLIGYLSKTQEAAMIASISVGSVLLFVSNVVLPVEGMARFAQTVAKCNPYIVLSELLKKSMLYGVSIGQISRELGLVFILVALFVVLAVLIQRRIKRRYFRQEETLLAEHVPAPLRLGTAQIHNAAELLEALDKMTRTEFDALVTADDNPISQWAQAELRERRLARQLRTKSKERMILRLDKYLEKHGKNIKR